MYSIPLDNFIYYGNCGVTLSWLSEATITAVASPDINTVGHNASVLSLLIFKDEFEKEVNG